MHGEVGLLPGGQRADDHARAEIGAADADIDDVGDPLAGETAPVAAVDALAEALQAREHRPHFRRRAGAGAQGHVADGAALGVVDPLAGQHLLFPAVDVGSPGQRVEQGERFRGDPLLREIEQQAVLAQGETREAPGISGEQFAQVERAHRLGVSRQGAPGRGIDDAHSQIISPGSNLWISAGCEGKIRIRYSSRPQFSGFRSMVYSVSPLPVTPSLRNG